MKNFIHNFDWQVAMWTTRLLLMIIGGAAIVGFFCSLKIFFLVISVVLSIGGWLVLYTFFAEMARRGRRYERAN